MKNTILTGYNIKFLFCQKTEFTYSLWIATILLKKYRDNSVRIHKLSHTLNKKSAMTSWILMLEEVQDSRILKNKQWKLLSNFACYTFK